MPATPPLTKCLACGGATVRATRRNTITYRGRSATYDAPGWWCAKCGEGYFDDADLDHYDRALADLKAEVEGVLKPAEVRRIREKTGLSQRTAGRVLGGGVHAFQKYESGSATVSDAMANLLRAIDKHPAVLRTLCKAKGVAPADRKRAARHKRSA
ncbi:MAG TPA: type II toxin-antitoxin system MqsA family antitoxin [Alphaproteobacteria bacterium]|nr:type II toxin-antitoxin system MqsA family antitoxin [Alphaproteobacteria bacterium]